MKWLVHRQELATYILAYECFALQNSPIPFNFVEFGRTGGNIAPPHSNWSWSISLCTGAGEDC